MNEKVNEQILIEKAKANDNEAMEELIRQNYNFVKSYLIKLTLNYDLAEDLTQETFYKALIKIKAFKIEAKFSSWLIVIATNLYKDFLKKKGRNYEDIDELNMEGDFNTEAAVLASIEFKELLNILKDMPYEKRMPFILKNFYQNSYEEISNIMNCSTGTIKSRIHYCVKIIKEKMKVGDFI